MVNLIVRCFVQQEPFGTIWKNTPGSPSGDRGLNARISKTFGPNLLEKTLTDDGGKVARYSGNILDQLIARAVSKVLDENPYLKCWVAPKDLAHDLRIEIRKVDSAGLSQAQVVYLVATLLRRLVIRYLRRMDDWTIYFDRLKLKPDQPFTVQGWIDRHQAVENLAEIEQVVYQLLIYGGLTINEVAVLTQISDLSLEEIMVKAETQITGLTESSVKQPAKRSVSYCFARIASLF